MSEISNGICKLTEYDNSIFYKAQCSCHSERDEQTLVLSYEPDVNQITLEIFSNVYTDYSWVSSDTMWGRFTAWWRNQTRKFKKIWELLTTGQTSADNAFIFGSEEQIKDYIKALEQGLEKVQESKETFNTKVLNVK